MEFGETGTWPEDLWKVRARANMRMTGEAGSNRWHLLSSHTARQGNSSPHILILTTKSRLSQIHKVILDLEVKSSTPGGGNGLINDRLTMRSELSLSLSRDKKLAERADFIKGGEVKTRSRHPRVLVQTESGRATSLFTL